MSKKAKTSYNLEWREYYNILSAGADLQGTPGMHQHTLQFQTVEDIYMYFCKKENKKNIQEKMITQWPLLRPC